MELTKKILAIIVAVSVAITLFAVAVWQNIGGLGTSLTGAGGPVASGFYKIANAPLLWASSGGWPTLAVFYCGFIAVMFGFAWVIWHFDVPYKITGATQQPLGDLTHSVTREPEEPERAPQPIPAEE